ncbi:aldo/keto reductase [Paenibacillus sp. y28]|uniref:aldo/keto reductase n=1 Tax=Paenibacillus sp. y28 TaxID=3129110 RepID=UPI00301A0883
MFAVQYKTVGNSGLRLSALTFGCWELGGGPWEFTSDQNNIAAVRKALELGITTFDTAEGYGEGHSEQVLAAALEGERSRCVIASKVSRSHLQPDEVLRAAERSLTNLKTDYIDIYYIHWPSFDIPVKETLSAFNKLKEQKLIRAIGVSNFSLEQLQEAAQYAQIDIIQPEYSLLQRGIEKDVLPYCLANGIGIASYSSIAKGILTGAFHFGGKKLAEDDFRQARRLFYPEHLDAASDLLNTMKNIADIKGVTVSEIAISWLIHQEAVTSAIVGTQNLHHLEANAAAADIVLSAEELQQIDQASQEALRRIDG